MFVKIDMLILVNYVYYRGGMPHIYQNPIPAIWFSDRDTQQHLSIPNPCHTVQPP
jgi:hypothetical protein